MVRARVPVQVDELTSLSVSFGRHLAAENVSPETLRTYLISVRQLAAFLAAQGMPRAVAHIKREHLEAFPGVVRGSDGTPSQDKARRGSSRSNRQLVRFSGHQVVPSQR